MTKRRKIVYWSMGGLSLLLALALVSLLLAPKLINLEFIKEKTLAHVSKKVGGQVECQHINLTFFPRPQATLRQVSLLLPAKAEGTVTSLLIYPKIMPLLRGKVEVAEVEAEAPEFIVQLPERPVEKRDELRLTKDLEKIAGSLLAPLSVAVPDLILVVRNGSLDVVDKGKTVLCFEGVEARAVLPPSGYKIHLSCGSNLWENMALKGTLDLKDFKAEGRIALARFQPHKLANYLFPQTSPDISDSQVNLTFGFAMDGLKIWKAELEGSLPRLVLQRGKEELVIRGKNLKADFLMDGKRVEVSLSELDLDYPQLTLSGNLLKDQVSQRYSLELEGREADVHSLRKAAMVVAGEMRSVKKVLGVVKGGRFPLFALNGEGSRIADLAKLENLMIKADIVDGKIVIPKAYSGFKDIDLDLERVSGDVLVSKGMLEGKKLQARWQNAQVREGVFRLGLTKKAPLLHLDARVEVDLSQLPPLLKELVKNKTFAQEVDRTHEMSGNALGRLVIGERIGAIKTKLDVSELNLYARHELVPYPLDIGGGHLVYDGTGIDIKNLSGKMGHSSFSRLSGAIEWGKEPYLEVTSANSIVFLDEIYPWLSSYETLRGALKEVESVKGTVRLSEVHLEGPLLRPEKWHFETAGEVQEFSMNTTVISEPITATAGKFRANQERFSATDFRTKFLDASLSMSGSLYAYMQGLRGGDLAFKGQVGPDAIQWLSDFARLEYGNKLRSPLYIKQAHVLWKENGETSVEADLSVQNGPGIHADIFQSPKQLVVKSLAIRDEQSNATMSLNLQDQALGFTFSGELTERTLDKLFLDYRLENGWIRGDFRAHIQMDQPMKSTAEGKLEVEDLTLPWPFKAPLEIDRISLNAQENKIIVESGSCEWREVCFGLSGDVIFSEKSILLDMDLRTGPLELDRLASAFETGAKDRDARSTQGLFGVPLEGTVRLKSESLSYEQFTWAPFHAYIAIAPGEVHVNITEANWCGISTPGVVVATPQEIFLDFQPVAANQPLSPVLNCLPLQHAQMTGSFDLKGHVTARGKAEKLLESLQGDLEFVAKEGRIQRHIPLAKVFAFLNVTEAFRGKPLGFDKEGLAYDSLSVKGKFEKGKLLVKEAVLDGVTMEIAGHGEISLIDKKMDAQILVAPFRTIDWVIKKTPLVGYILAGTLVSIPIKVTGEIDNPKVTPLPASAVGSGLLGMMKRTFKLPIKVIEAVLPKNKK